MGHDMMQTGVGFLETGKIHDESCFVTRVHEHEVTSVALRNAYNEDDQRSMSTLRQATSLKWRGA